MRRLGGRLEVLGIVAAAAALFAFALAGTAQAKLTGEFKHFEQCPYTTAGVDRCLLSTTTGGEVVLGSKKVPIVNPVPLQGGYSVPAEGGPEDGFSKFFAAKNGVTLAPVPQPVPGGLAGLVNCKEISNIILRISCEVTFENGVTGLNSTLELARPASEIRINELNLALGEGIVLKMPVRFHLENPFLGSSCYVGSSTTPVKWELRTDTTKPPAPNKPITGKPGEFEFFEEGQVLEIHNLEFVDNSWSAPGASGCGGIFSFILDPIVNSAAGLPAAAGRNTAKLQNRAFESPAFAVKRNNEENP
jgi:hypothetical protein